MKAFAEEWRKKKPCYNGLRSGQDVRSGYQERTKVGQLREHLCARH